MKNKILEIFAWYGVAAILTAYALVSFELIEPNNVLFPILNGTGALGILLHSIVKRDYQPVFLNIVWLIIALIALINISIL